MVEEAVRFDEHPQRVVRRRERKCAAPGWICAHDVRNAVLERFHASAFDRTPIGVCDLDLYRWPLGRLGVRRVRHDACATNEVSSFFGNPYGERRHLRGASRGRLALRADYRRNRVGRAQEEIQTRETSERDKRDDENDSSHPQSAGTGVRCGSRSYPCRQARLLVLRSSRTLRSRLLRSTDPTVSWINVHDMTSMASNATRQPRNAFGNLLLRALCGAGLRLSSLLTVALLANGCESLSERTYVTDVPEEGTVKTRAETEREVAQAALVDTVIRLAAFAATGQVPSRN